MSYYAWEADYSEDTPYINFEYGERAVRSRGAPPPPDAKVKLIARSNIQDPPDMRDVQLSAYRVVSEPAREVLLGLSLPLTYLVEAEVHVGSQVYPYWVVRLDNILDCIDVTASDLDRDNDGYIRTIRHLVLDEAALGKQDASFLDLFRPKVPGTLYLVSERFKAAIEAAGCTGSVFVPVEQWRSGFDPHG